MKRFSRRAALHAVKCSHFSCVHRRTSDNRGQFSSAQRRILLARAINWQAVFLEPGAGPESDRVMGLHPKLPLSGRVLRELRAASLA